MSGKYSQGDLYVYFLIWFMGRQFLTHHIQHCLESGDLQTFALISRNKILRMLEPERKEAVCSELVFFSWVFGTFMKQQDEIKLRKEND